MSSSEQQCPSRYPSFPGNIEVLSMPSTSPKESYESSPATTTTARFSPPQQSPRLHSFNRTSSSEGKPKRRQTLAACRPCRKRKSRCDGARPRCNTCADKSTPCEYSVEEGKTQQQASREELKAYRTVVKMLRNASPGRTSIMLQHLKAHDDVSDAVKTILSDTTLCDRTVVPGA